MGKERRGSGWCPGIPNTYTGFFLSSYTPLRGALQEEAGRNPWQLLLGSRFPGRTRERRRQCLDNQLDRQPKMSLSFCHPNFFPVQLWDPSQYQGQNGRRADGQSSPLPRDALGFLHTQVPARTGQQPVTDAAPYSLPPEDILRGISQCLWFLLAV